MNFWTELLGNERKNYPANCSAQEGNSCVVQDGSRCSHHGDEKKCPIYRDYISKGIDYSNIRARLQQDKRRKLNSA